MKSAGNKGYQDTIEAFQEQQNTFLPRFVEKTEEMKDEIFEYTQTIQFGSIDLGKHKAFTRLVQAKSKVKNPKVLIYISGQNKLQFYNNIDDVMDAVEDIVAGEFEGVSFSLFSEEYLIVDQFGPIRCLNLS